MGTKRLTAIVLFICSSFYSAIATDLNKKLYFKSFDVLNGLSQNTVNCIFQDSMGFMWFGTKDGLNRYDGNLFTVFRPLTDNGSQLGDDHIKTIFEDRQNNIWIGTSFGVYIFNTIKEEFKKLSICTKSGITIESPINDIIEDNNGNIWISTWRQGLFRLKENCLVQYLSDHVSVNINNLSLDQCGRIWYVSNNLLYYSENDKFVVFKPEINSKLIDITISSDEIYVLTAEKIVILHPLTLKIIAEYNLGKPLKQAKQLMIINDTEAWIATGNGIILFDMATGESRSITSDEDDPFSLQDNNITCMMQDKAGGIWVGTYDCGTSYFPKQYSYFEKYYPTGENSGLTGRRIREMLEREDGNIWISTDGHGLFLHDIHKDEITQFVTDSRCMNIRALCQLNKNELWIGTYSKGLSVIKSSDGSVKWHKGYISDKEATDIFALHKENDSTLLIGTNHGLFRCNSKSMTFDKIKELGDSELRDIFKSQQGDIYCATATNGLFYYSAAHDTWCHFLYDRNDSLSLSRNTVQDVMQDSKGTIWLTTLGGGICKFDNITNKFSRFTIDDGLPSNNTSMIVEDNSGYLWISTDNNGLCRFNPETGEFKHYSTHDGLLSDQFSYHSGIKSRSGKLYFGTNRGFISFIPETFIENEYSPSLVFVDFRILKRQSSEDEQIFNRQVIVKNDIELPYKHNSFSIRFAVLNYYAPCRNEVLYTMKGMDKEWRTAKGNSSITFHNMKPGRYHLNAKLCGENTDTEDLEINILPPWWLSIWAKLTYVLLAVFLLYLGYLYAKKKYETKKRNMELRLKQEKEKELYDEKIRFFTNIAHEIRTPVTLIKSPLDKILQDERPVPYKEDLNIMKRNTNRLLDLINQLLDFRKIEEERYKLHLVCCDIQATLEEHVNSFRPVAKIKGLKIFSDLPNSRIWANIDSDAFMKIINNLLSNAVKNAMSYVSVILDTHNDDNTDYFEVIIHNDGTTIPEDMREQIFKPFVQYKHPDTDKVQTGTGLGLSLARSLAEMHGGSLTLMDNAKDTAFCLRLPKNLGFPDNPDSLPSTHEEKDAKQDRPLLLIAEDDIDMAAYLSRLLSTKYNIITVYSGSQAISVLKKHIFQTVISDIMMPDIDGFKLCAYIKQNPATSHIPVILLTAKTDNESKIMGIEYGADAYIEKPFENSYLLAQIESILSNRMKIIESYKRYPLLFTGSTGNSEEDKFIRKVNDVLQDNIANPQFTKDEFASAMSMSRSNLYRKIKGTFDMSPNELIRTERLKTAAGILSDGNYHISEICYMVGFASPSYFTKCFTRQYGISPKEYGNHKIVESAQSV